MSEINTQAVVNYAKSMVGLGGYTAQCERFVREMFGFPRRYPSAKAAFRESAANGPIHRDFSPPQGVPVFWDLTGPNAEFGHVALSIGGGWAISTSNERGEPGICAINIRRFTDASALYLGWAEFYHGRRVYGAAPTAQASPSAGHGIMHGVDVHARWQAGLRASDLPGVSFVITKATGGTDFVVNGWESMLNGAKLTGIYHYARERGYAGDPAREAANFVAQALKGPSDALLVLDWEESQNTDLGDVDWILEWMHLVENDLGRKPLFYTYLSVLKAHPGLARVQQAGYGLWLARYPHTGPVGWQAWDPPAAPHWERPVMWQYSDAGGIDGHPGRLDLNIFYGSADDWHALARNHHLSARKEEEDMFIVKRAGDGTCYLVGATSAKHISYPQYVALSKAGVRVVELGPQEVYNLIEAIHESADYERVVQDAYAASRETQA